MFVRKDSVDGTASAWLCRTRSLEGDRGRRRVDFGSNAISNLVDSDLVPDLPDGSRRRGARFRASALAVATMRSNSSCLIFPGPDLSGNQAAFGLEKALQYELCRVKSHEILSKSGFGYISAGFEC
jgi:hypothetical protein